VVVSAGNSPSSLRPFDRRFKGGTAKSQHRRSVLALRFWVLQAAGVTPSSLDRASAGSSASSAGSAVSLSG
jgi:hypothetical protein